MITKSHLACWYTKMFILIKHTICERLRKIQYFRHECSSIIKGRGIICSYIWRVNISKCVFCLNTYSVKVWWRYILPNTNALHFVHTNYQSLDKIYDTKHKYHLLFKHGCSWQPWCIFITSCSCYILPYFYHSKAKQMMNFELSNEPTSYIPKHLNKFNINYSSKSA